jgi:tetratricopeptide (TPR) repeat protein
MKLSQTRIAIAMAILVVTTSSGCGTVNRIRAKNELNEAAHSYREGNFAEAEQHSRKALDLDPDNKTALNFIARTIHAQYKPGVQAAENVAKANEAIQAYQRILEKDPKNDEAYKAIAYLYEALKDEDKLKSWITARSVDQSVAPEKRAESFIVLASKDWDCSFKITELPTNKSTAMESGTKMVVTYKKPNDQKDFDTAQRCVKRGLEEVENAIKLDPNSEGAWSYKTNLLLEASKLAEMEGNKERKAELDKQRDLAQKRTNQLSEANQKKKEQEAAAKATPTP